MEADSVEKPIAPELDADGSTAVAKAAVAKAAVALGFAIARRAVCGIAETH